MGQCAVIANTAAAIIALCDNHVLLVRNHKRHGSVEIPGGALLNGENEFDAAIREMYEECGLRVERDDLVPFHIEDAHGWRVHVLRALRWSGEMTPGDDVSEVFWGTPDLLLDGQHSEDYATVCRTLHQHRAAFGR